MARQADFIQENIPEQLELKQRVLGEVSRHARADVIIASSTSGLHADGPAGASCNIQNASVSRIRSIRFTCCRSWNWWAA